jgi:hypothetical protein
MPSIHSIQRASLGLLVLVGLLGATAAAAQPGASHPMRSLSGDEMERYLKVLDELVVSGLEAPALIGSASRGGVAGQAAGIQYSERMQSTIASGGFTLASFSDVHWNAMTAYAAAEMEKHRAEFDRSRAQQESQLLAMKSQLSPEQYAQMVQAMGAVGQMPFVGEIPPGNLALIKSHRAELDAIIAKGQRARSQ